MAAVLEVVVGRQPVPARGQRAEVIDAAAGEGGDVHRTQQRVAGGAQRMRDLGRIGERGRGSRHARQRSIFDRPARSAAGLAAAAYQFFTSVRRAERDSMG